MTVESTYDELLPSRWVKAVDIPEEKNLVLTVTDITFEPVGMDKEMKLVLHFSESPKSLVLNRTNAITLKTLFGNNPNAAVGKRIALYATPVSFGGQTTMGVRINPQAPKQLATKKVDLNAYEPTLPPMPEEMPEEMIF